MPRAAMEDPSRMSVRVLAERRHLSARDNLRVLGLLEHPPKPNAKLRAAARALPKKEP